MNDHDEEVKKILITQQNNSLVFSWKYPIEWYVVSIPCGIYTFEQINEKLNKRVCELMGNASVSCEGNSVYKQLIIFDEDSISIKSPRIIIDVYQSNIRTIAGWSEREESSVNYFTYGDYFVEELD